MNGPIRRRGFCAGVVVASTAGCLGVLGRERERLTAVRDSPQAERSWELELRRGDRIIIEYQSDESSPSRMVVEGPDGTVVYDNTVRDRGSLRYSAGESGVHTLRFEWGSRARIDIYLES